MSITLGFSPLLLIAAVFMAAALTWWAYRTTTPPLSLKRRLVPASLRFTALFLICFLLFEPVLRRFSTQSQKPVVVVLVDDSESMRVTSADTTGTAIIQAIRQARPPADMADVRVVRFSDGLLGTDTSYFRGPRTDLTRALEQIRDAYTSEHLRAVILVSDGRYNTGRSPLPTADRYPVPIHAVVVGDTATRRDISIDRLQATETAFVGVDVPVRASVRTPGFPTLQPTLRLIQDGRVVASAVAARTAGTDEARADLVWKPERAGLFQLTVSAPAQQGEVTTRNNSRTLSIRVIDRKRRVLLLAGAPDPDVATVRSLLETTSGTEVTTLVQKAPGAFYDGALPDRFDEVEAIVLVNYPGRATDPATLQRVATAARAGTPLVFVLGSQTNLALVQRYLQDVLPVTLGAIRTTFIEAGFEPNTAGMTHPVMERQEIESSDWLRLPPLMYNESDWEATADARVLATTRIRDVPLNEPLLVIRTRAGVRSAALLGAGTWRWRNLPLDLERLTPVWPGLMDDLMQWVTIRDDRRALRVRPTHPVFAENEPVRFVGEAYDESMNPLDGVAIDVTVTGAAPPEVTHRMESIGSGRYTRDVGTLPAGRYRFSAVGRHDDENIGTDAGTFEVGRTDLEYRHVTADAALMGQIARRSGGTLRTAAEAAGLPALLRSSGELTPRTRRFETQSELWRFLPFLVLAIALLGTEWFLRKRSGMI